MADLITMLSAVAGQQGEEADEDFNQTVLLLHGDGTNGAQNNTFLDGSTNNFTITRNGNTTQGTFSPFSVGAGEWSNYFDGTGDYLQYTSNNSAFDLSSGSFTVEAWVYQLSAKLVNVISYKEADWRIQINANQSVSYVTPYSERIISSSGAAALNTWNHLAISCDGTTVTLYINGVSAGTSNVLPSSGASTGIYIGRNAATTAWDFNGYISNVRVVKGTNVYPSAFTPPTAPLTAITNTSLLTCQSNRFVDNSTNAFAITRNGDVRVTPFSPFAPTAAYSAGTNGGSGYFDGSGDYLATPSNSALTATGDFTFECWVYVTNTSTNFQGFFSTRVAGGNGLSLGKDNQLFEAVINGSLIGTTAITYNAWTHLVIARSGSGSNNVAFWANGTRIATLTNTSSTSTTSAVVGRFYTNSSGFELGGYVADARMVNGAAVYDPANTTITVPTAPLTAISNTSLLCNFTNAGIFDQTGKNVLETVGNAQVDTNVRKFGTGSMKFDGTDDRLVMPSNPELNLSSGNFTIEAWVYWTGSNANAKLLSKDGASGSSYAQYNLGMNGSGYMGASIGSGNGVSYIQSITSNTLLPTNQWVHIAFVKNGTNLSLYQNGTSVASATQSGTMVDGAKPLLIGYETGQAASNYWNGFIDDLRITKGVARYTANFTAPTKAFPDQ